MECSNSSSKREVYSNTILLQETREKKKQEKHLIDNLTIHLKQLEKEEEQQQQISRRK